MGNCLSMKATDRHLRMLLVGYFGHGNLGDEMMLHAFLQGLRERVNFSACAISGSPDETERMHSITAIGKFDILGIVDRMRKADVVVGCGGSLLQDATSFRSLAYYVGLIVLSRSLGVAPVLLAQGLGPLRRRVSKRLAGLALRCCSLITFRDEVSLELAKTLCAVHDKAYLTADLAFILTPPHGAKPPQENMLLAIAMRPWRGVDEVLECVVDGILKLKNRISAVRCISFSRDDVEVNERLSSLLKQMEVEVITPRSIEELWEAMECVHLLIGSRLHSLILACMLGIPSIAISYDPKVEAFMRGWASRFCIPWEGVSSEAVKERLAECIDRWYELRDSALSFAHTSRELSKLNLELFLSELHRS
jgi:polysaccharide pyruvyl transferase CsaB